MIIYLFFDSEETWNNNLPSVLLDLNQMFRGYCITTDIVLCAIDIDIRQQQSEIHSK